MTPSDAQALVWFVVLLAANAFFVGSEFAVISARRAQIEPRALAGSRPAKITILAMERVSLMLATAQLGITLCSLLILNVVEPSLHHIFEIPLKALNIPEAALDAIAFIVTLVIVTYLHVVIGEMVPKNISFSIPERAALILVPPLYAIAWLLKPLVFSLNAVANGILRLFRIEPKDEATSSYTLDQVEDIVAHSTREGVLKDTSGALTNTFEFTEKRVSDVAIAIDRVVSVAETATPREIEQAVAKYGFSRYPIRDENNEIFGYLHLKDVLDLDQDEVDDPVPAKRIRALISLAESIELEDALAIMKRSSAHLARVYSSAGTLTGVLFLEDILEELVGEVHDATRRS